MEDIEKKKTLAAGSGTHNQNNFTSKMRQLLTTKDYRWPESFQRNESSDNSLERASDTQNRRPSLGREYHCHTGHWSCRPTSLSSFLSLRRLDITKLRDNGSSLSECSASGCTGARLAKTSATWHWLKSLPNQAYPSGLTWCDLLTRRK